MNLEEEVIDGHLVTTQAKKIWRVELDLAKQLMRVCDKYNIKIWMFAGTLLGAVRHKGFIPWDDDMDFIMMREDYDKLLQHSDEFKHPYFLQSVLTEKGYYRGHAQLRNSETSAILPGDLWQNFNQGIFIDIFVFDNVSDDREEFKKIMHRAHGEIMKLHEQTYLSILMRYFGKSLWILYRWLRSGIKSNRSEFLKAEKIITAIPPNKEGWITDAMLSEFNRIPRLRQWYAETVYLPFEDMMLPAPINYHEELTEIYGDYMKPVKGGSFHGTVIFDTETPYKDKLKQLRKTRPLVECLKSYFILRPIKA